MLFSHATIFQLATALPDNFEDLLAGQAFEPCTAFNPSSFGWISPLPEGFDDFTRAFGQRVLFCAKVEDKVIPPTAIKDLVSEKTTQFTRLEGNRPSTKQKQQFKEAALDELLPRALCKHRKILAYIDPQAGLLVINSGAATDVERFVNYLRMTLGSLEIRRADGGHSVVHLYTQWVRRGKAPEGFDLADACNLIDPETNASVTCRKVSLRNSEILTHLDAGKLCAQIRLTWAQELSFTIDKDLIIRQLKYDVLTDATETDAAEDLEPEIRALAELDAQFALLSQEIAAFYPKLAQALS